MQALTSLTHTHPHTHAGAVKISNQKGLGNLPWLLHKQDAPISLGRFSMCDCAFIFVWQFDCRLVMYASSCTVIYYPFHIGIQGWVVENK